MAPGSPLLGVIGGDGGGNTFITGEAPATEWWERAGKMLRRTAWWLHFFRKENVRVEILMCSCVVSNHIE